MTFSRRFRIFYLVVIELAQKYTGALAAGFVLGLVLTVATVRIFPFVFS